MTEDKRIIYIMRLCDYASHTLYDIEHDLQKSLNTLQYNKKLKLYEWLKNEIEIVHSISKDLLGKIEKRKFVEPKLLKTSIFDIIKHLKKAEIFIGHLKKFMEVTSENFMEPANLIPYLNVWKEKYIIYVNSRQK